MESTYRCQAVSSAFAAFRTSAGTESPASAAFGAAPRTASTPVDDFVHHRMKWAVCSEETVVAEFLAASEIGPGLAAVGGRPGVQPVGRDSSPQRWMVPEASVLNARIREITPLS